MTIELNGYQLNGCLLIGIGISFITENRVAFEETKYKNPKCIKMYYTFCLITKLKPHYSIHNLIFM